MQSKKCRAYFDALPDRIGEIRHRMVTAIRDDVIGWTVCRVWPDIIFQSESRVAMWTTHRMAHNAVHEAAHLAACSIQDKLTSYEREAIAYQAERACFGHVGEVEHSDETPLGD